MFQEHEKTKKNIVEALKTEVLDLKKELQQRKKLIVMQQQIIQHGTETYNKVRWFIYLLICLFNSYFAIHHSSRRFICS